MRRPSYGIDFRLLEQITDPWLLNAARGRSCVLQNVVTKQNSMEFEIARDLKWSNGEPLSEATLVSLLSKQIELLNERSNVTLKKKNGTTWRLDWSQSSFVPYALQRSEYGVIHPENTTERSIQNLSPTFGPYVASRVSDTSIRLTANPNYPSRCQGAKFDLEIVDRESSQVRDKPTDVDFVQTEPDRATHFDGRILQNNFPRAVYLGTTAVWATVVFSPTVPSSSRRSIRDGWSRCVKGLKPLKQREIFALSVKADMESSRILGALKECIGTSMDLRIVANDEFSQVRQSGHESVFNYLGLRFPDPDDLWMFLRGFYPHLARVLITDERLARARELRKQGSLKGYDIFDEIQKDDPWIIKLNSVKTRIHFRKGLKFQSESDVILRLNGITEE